MEKMRFSTRIKETDDIHTIEKRHTAYEGEGELSFLPYGRLGNHLFRLAAMLNIQDKNKSFKIIPSLTGPEKSSVNTYDWGNIFKKNIVNHYSERSVNGYDVFVRDASKFSKRVHRELPVFPRKRVLYNIMCLSYKYFEDIDIHDYFTFEDKITDYVRDKYGDLLTYKTVSIHVRRGDYLSRRRKNISWHCDNKYYETALSMLKGIEKVVVLSDDIEWCKKNFKGNNFVFIEGESQYVDMCLMSFLHSNIIVNSTFSWWGAYLNQNKDKTVICPSYHYKCFEEEDIYFNKKYYYPDSWITIDNRS